MAEVIPVLKPLEVATALLSSEAAPPASSVYPMLWGLVNVHLTPKEEDLSTIHDVKETLSKEIKKRFEKTALTTSTNALITATVLDPQFKQMNGFANDFRKAAQDNVISLMSKVELPKTMPVTPSDLAAAEPSTKKKCLGLSFLLGEQETAVAPEIPTADDEFQRYFGERTVINETYEILK